MRILLLNPPFYPRFSRSQRSPAVTKSGTFYYPFWLAYATGLLEKYGYEVKLLDAPAENLSRAETIKIVSEFTPQLLIIDTSTPSIYNDLEIAGELKNRIPNSFCLLVGTHVSTLAEETLRMPYAIDAVARGEYDVTVLELAEAIKHNCLDLDRKSVV